MLQLPYGLKPDARETLTAYLKALPREFQYVVEFRHKGWLKPETFRLPADHGVTLCLVDHPRSPRLAETTADLVYIRLLGDRKDVSDDHYDTVTCDRSERIAWWAERVIEFLTRGHRVWVTTNNHYAGHSPATIEGMRRLVGI